LTFERKGQGGKCQKTLVESIRKAKTARKRSTQKGNKVGIEMGVRIEETSTPAKWGGTGARKKKKNVEGFGGDKPLGGGGRVDQIFERGGKKGVGDANVRPAAGTLGILGESEIIFDGNNIKSSKSLVSLGGNLDGPEDLNGFCILAEGGEVMRKG